MKLLDLPYGSRRMPVVAKHGVVATSQHLAAQAGLAALRDGGTAVDAALATAAMLTVVEPTSNGIGSDAFALVWDGGKLHGLNASGRAPSALTIDRLRAQGHRSMPARGWAAVTVPGAPRAWRDLHDKFGRLPFERVLKPAIDTAREGYAASPVTARAWGVAARIYGRQSGPEFAPWFDTFTTDRTPPAAGDFVVLPDHARTLERIAATGSDDFYSGALADKIAAFAAETAGYIVKEDLKRHTSTWVEPIGTSYRGYDVWEIPPNGQGITALTALNILEGFELAKLQRESAEAYHLQIEATKLAFADAFAYVADPEHADVPIKGLLDKEYAAKRRNLIGDRAATVTAGDPPRGGTVYLCATDRDGMMISYIQSNYQGFGSGVVVPGTGIALQNRGHGFRLDPGHPNALAPGKRPFHTIIPAFLTKDGQAVGPFGVMGGHMQPQGHLQMVVNTVDWGMNPQASLDAPRWQADESLTGVDVEAAVPPGVRAGLTQRGHRLADAEAGGFGKGQIIWRTPNGGYVAGTEPRADGAVLGY